MEWIKILIPLVVAVVWILSHLAGNQQNQRRAQPPRPLPPLEPDDAARQARSGQDLEDFMAEVKRRQQEAEDRAAVEPIIVAEEAPPIRPKPPPLPRTAELRRRSIPIESRKSPRHLEPVIVVQPIPEPAPPPRLVTAAPALPPPPPPSPVHRPEALPVRAPQTPAIKLVRDLLKNRQSMRAAMLLREILDRPLCKRPRRVS